MSILTAILLVVALGLAIVPLVLVIAYTLTAFLPEGL